MALGLTPSLDPQERWELYDCELSAPTREWRDRANETPISHRWLRTWYKPLDRVHELSLRASPWLTLIKQRDRELEAVRMSKLFTTIDLPAFTVPFGTFSTPIRIPASEVEPTRRILW